MAIDPDALREIRDRIRAHLLGQRTPAGHWVGELSASALSTATAATALAAVDREAHAPLVRAGLRWLASHANPDGGWGDTVASISNPSTTVLCWSALAMAPPEDAADFAPSAARAEAWLASHAGGIDPGALAGAIIAFYGEDRTFSAPILTMAAIAGRLGRPADAWRIVPQLPFELAASPDRIWKWLRLPVVSYALPALVAVGLARHGIAPSRNPLRRLVRRASRERALRVALRMQPESGGFLEAAPITSFVAMSLAAAGLRAHPIVDRAVAFLRVSVRPDGSWPIDTNLATWVTTLSVNALHAAGGADPLPPEDRVAILDWLLAQQHRERHPYTSAEPGGWAWTDLSGGVPDADDTAGALVALRHLDPQGARARAAASAGLGWLLGLQNRDGGIPTFCRGWGALPFDRSSPDLTAHALAAWSAWVDDVPPALAARIRKGMDRAIGFLARAQRGDGAWVPLWFGNQSVEAYENPTYGTARVVAAIRRLHPPLAAKGAAWLLAAQNDDGGWGGGPGALSSIEETGLAAHALAGLPDAREAVDRAAAWLVEATGGGRRFAPAPIGLYFAKLWYHERLYPVIFCAAALERIAGGGGSHS
ncbi:MAG: squalene--hopene cyclase [Planctomycetes bacterium]|nr:squalene--hopene cyclase [Planctomycetota bacterium]